MPKLIDRTLKKFKLNKFVVVGVIGAIFLYVSAAGTVSFTYPWFANDNSDELAHVDMIWRIWNGDLPKASDGLRYQPFIDRGGANVYQRAAGHPPLFHSMMAPFMGPLLNQHKWKGAIAIGRSINILIGILCILALSWAGWLVGGNRKELLAVAVPAIAVLTYRYSRINTDLSMDGLLVLLSTLTLINLYKILQKGLKTKYLLWLALLMVAGMATKLSYGIFVALALATVLFVSYLRGKDDTKRKLIKGSFIAGALLVIVVAATGWYFYFRNYKSSGSFLTPISGEIPSSRKHQTYFQILTGTQFWSLFYARISAFPAVGVVVTTLAVSGYFIRQKINILKLNLKSLQTQTLLLLGLAFVGVVLSQIKFAHPTGSINFRYLLPALLPISLFLSYGLLEFDRLRGQLVTFASLLLAGSTILSMGLKPASETIVPGFLEGQKGIGKIYTAAASNEVPNLVITILLLLFVLGTVCIAISMFQLTKAKRLTKP